MNIFETILSGLIPKFIPEWVDEPTSIVLEQYKPVEYTLHYHEGLSGNWTMPPNNHWCISGWVDGLRDGKHIIEYKPKKKDSFLYW